MPVMDLSWRKDYFTGVIAWEGRRVAVRLGLSGLGAVEPVYGYPLRTSLQS